MDAEFWSPGSGANFILTVKMSWKGKPVWHWTQVGQGVLVQGPVGREAWLKLVKDKKQEKGGVGGERSGDGVEEEETRQRGGIEQYWTVGQHLELDLYDVNIKGKIHVNYLIPNFSLHGMALNGK
jgi:hypothetical protein